MILHNIYMPVEEKLERHWELFYRAQRLYIDEHKVLHIPRWNTATLSTSSSERRPEGCRMISFGKTLNDASGYP